MPCRRECYSSSHESARETLSLCGTHRRQVRGGTARAYTMRPPLRQLVGPTPCGVGRRLVPPACCCPPGGPRPTPPSRHQAQWNHKWPQRARGLAGRGRARVCCGYCLHSPQGTQRPAGEAVGHHRGAQTRPARSPLPHLLAAAAANPPSAMRGCLPLPPPPPGGRVGKSFKNQVVRRWCASHTPEPVALPLTKPVLAT